MKLNLLCGAHIVPNWIGVDTDPPAEWQIDVRMGLPTQDASVTHIYTQHGLEHLERADGVALLRECQRVLKPGGLLRISIPDLDTLVKKYQANDIRFAESVGWLPATRCQMLNEGMRLWGHTFLYSFEELVLVLGEAGFRGPVYRMPYRQSSDPTMLLETRPDLGDLIVEVTR